MMRQTGGLAFGEISTKSSSASSAICRACTRGTTPVSYTHLTDEGDYQVKLRNLIRFLTEGDKAKVTLRFRGREMAHQDLGMNLLKRVETDLTPHGAVEQRPRMEGRQMVMTIAPIKKN